jgi:transposase
LVSLYHQQLFSKIKSVKDIEKLKQKFDVIADCFEDFFHKRKSKIIYCIVKRVIEKGIEKGLINEDENVIDLRLLKV